ncbi:MAG: SRPBCC family protein, partial [Gammaproteobacteria bacterium]
APPERIHRIMVYPDTLPDLDHGTTMWQPEELPPRVGTLVRIKGKLLGVPLPFRATTRFVEIDPPRRMVTELVRPSFVTFRWILDLEEVPGGTRASNSFEVWSAWWAAPLGRLLAAVLHRRVRVGMDALLRRLGPPR